MPLDTSIPLGIQMPQFAEPVDPATRQYNALRQQALQQEMLRNQLIMQNTMEDRRLAAANRAQAAAEAAKTRRQQEETLRVLQGGFTPARNPVMGPGTIQAPTPAGYDFQSVTNALLQRGNLGGVEAVSKMQQQFAAQQKAQAEVPGTQAESRKKGAEADKAEFTNAFDQMSVLAPYIASGAMPARAAVDVLLKHPVAGKLLSSAMTPEQMMDFAEKNPQGVAQILATPPDKIYESLTKKPEFEVKETAQGLIQVPKGGGEAKPVMMGGAPVMPKPSAQQEKAAIQTKQLQGSIGTAISTLEDLIKPDSLLNQSTASGAGALTDKAAGFFGYATPGSIAASQLKVLADPILKMVPRFEGPQSDKDTKSYQEAAGQLGNEYLPAAQRKAAAETILKLFKARRDQFTSADLPEAVVGAPVASAGNKAVFDAADAILGGQ